MVAKTQQTSLQNEQVVRQRYFAQPILRDLAQSLPVKSAGSTINTQIDSGGCVEGVILELTSNIVMPTGDLVEVLICDSYENFFESLIANIKTKYNGLTLIDASGYTLGKLAKNYGADLIGYKNFEHRIVDPTSNGVNLASPYNRLKTLSPDHYELKTLVYVPVAQLQQGSIVGTVMLNSDVDTIDLTIKLATISELTNAIALQPTSIFAPDSDPLSIDTQINVYKVYRETPAMMLPEFTTRYQITEDEQILSGKGTFIHKLPTGFLYPSVSHEILDGQAISDNETELFTRVTRYTASNVPLDNATGSMLRQRHLRRVVPHRNSHIINLNGLDFQANALSVSAGAENIKIEYDCTTLTNPKLKIAYERLSGG